MKKVIKSTNQIKILILWVDSDGPPYTFSGGHFASLLGCDLYVSWYQQRNGYISLQKSFR